MLFALATYHEYSSSIRRDAHFKRLLRPQPPHSRALSRVVVGFALGDSLWTTAKPNIKIFLRTQLLNWTEVDRTEDDDPMNNYGVG